MKRSVYVDPVVRFYMRDVDRTLLRENLKLTPAQRLEKFARFASFAYKLQEAGQQARKAQKNRARK